MGIFSAERFIGYRFSEIMSIKIWKVPATPEERNSIIDSATTIVNTLSPYQNDCISRDYRNALAVLSDAKYYTRGYMALRFRDRDIIRMMIRVDRANYLSGFSIRFIPSDANNG